MNRAIFIGKSAFTLSGVGSKLPCSSLSRLDGSTGFQAFKLKWNWYFSYFSLVKLKLNCVLFSCLCIIILWIHDHISTQTNKGVVLSSSWNMFPAKAFFVLLISKVKIESSRTHFYMMNVFYFHVSTLLFCGYMTIYPRKQKEWMCCLHHGTCY